MALRESVNLDELMAINDTLITRQENERRANAHARELAKTQARNR